MKFQAILFDLDGTLADTVDDIAAAGNHMLVQMGRDPRPRNDYKLLAGRGVEYLVTEALGAVTKAEILRGMELFSHHYETHHHELTKPYEGIANMLDALTAAGVRLAVLSNKPHPFTQEVVSRVFAAWRFNPVVGAQEDIPLKPAPRAALTIAEQSKIPLRHWAYLGDTDVDMQTANNAGMFAIGCVWGFREEKELRDNGALAIVHHPAEVVQVMGGL